jgi:hypothetical protein
MFGSGRGVIKGILQGSGCEITEIRGEMNPGFRWRTPGNPLPRIFVHWQVPSARAWDSTALPPMVMPTGSARMDEHGNFIDPHKIWRWH